MTLNVFTARMGIRDPDYLDITRGGNNKRKTPHRNIGPTFAPSSGLLSDFLKNRRPSDESSTGEITDMQWLRYRKDYITEMRGSYREHGAQWHELLSWKRVVLVCFCDTTQCHRHVLARDILPKLGATYRGEIPHQGETQNQ